jgi:hypothetical protein
MMAKGLLPPISRKVQHQLRNRLEHSYTGRSNIILFFFTTFYDNYCHDIDGLSASSVSTFVFPGGYLDMNK